MGRLTFGFFVCCFSIIADHVYHQYASEFPYDRIVIDSLCHQAIACLSTLTYFAIANAIVTSSSSAALPFVNPSSAANTNTKTQQRVSKRYLALSVFFGALVDLDHILYSKSWTIQGAMQLPSRPIGHSIAFVFGITLLLRILSPCDTYVPVIYSLASLSHLIRDSSRRGLWLFWTLKTGPLSYLTHLILLCLLPYLIYHTSYFFERVFKTFANALSFCVNTVCCQSTRHNSTSRNYYQYYRQIAQSRASLSGRGNEVSLPESQSI